MSAFIHLNAYFLCRPHLVSRDMDPELACTVPKGDQKGHFRERPVEESKEDFKNQWFSMLIHLSKRCRDSPFFDA